MPKKDVTGIDEQSSSERSGDQSTFREALLKLIEKISDQTFLLVIAVGILLITATVAGAPDLRFVAIILSLLCLMVTGLYYFSKYRPPEVADHVHLTSKQKYAHMHQSRMAQRFWQPLLTVEPRIII